MNPTETIYKDAGLCSEKSQEQMLFTLPRGKFENLFNEPFYVLWDKMPAILLWNGLPTVCFRFEFYIVYVRAHLPIVGLLAIPDGAYR